MVILQKKPFLMTPFIDIHTHKLPQQEDMLSWGIHPWWFDDECYDAEADLQQLEAMLRDGKVAAIGETGLDRLHKASLPRQLEAFERQIALSERYAKPLIIHQVRVTDELLRLHQKHHPRQVWILHGFNGTTEEVRQLTGKGMSLSIGESLLYENRKIQKSISSIPWDHLFFETDEYHGEVETIYAKAAELRNLSLASLKEKIFANFARLNMTTWKTGEIVRVCSSATRV